ncbi:nucleotidyl transferase AbiEii/AbiGii toxin family protein [Leadbettera azotonutricia]|uniref:nucleotidyl transferase AbiEii/AbiGii toxin family protein n=1 Tax=Leadbettera azotonutricia TaxID=150829 RepID=UPI0002E67D54|nr:nucleotidyl transferase AbiEii/AbiGii toxin family protein [Leadbettera azotonutricia]
MLQKECVSKSLLILLKELQESDIFRDYFLVGGTSLALQMGHRRSDDIDLFTQNEIDKEMIGAFLFDNYKGKVLVINSQSIIYQVKINDIKVDFVKHPYNLVEPVKENDDIRYLGKKDIAAMKLRAIENSGNRAKDFVDIYYLLKEISLENMFDYYRKKYSAADINSVKRSLGYFDDVPDESWEEVRIIKNKPTVNKIKKTIIDKIIEYDKKYLYK